MQSLPDFTSFMTIARPALSLENHPIPPIPLEPTRVVGREGTSSEQRGMTCSRKPASARSRPVRLGVRRAHTAGTASVS